MPSMSSGVMKRVFMTIAVMVSGDTGSAWRSQHLMMSNNPEMMSSQANSVGNAGVSWRVP